MHDDAGGRRPSVPGRDRIRRPAEDRRGSACEERRGAPRVWLPAEVFVAVEDGPSARYAVSNLSAGGALLSDGPILALEAAVGITLRIRGVPPIELGGRVLRHDQLPDGPAVAIAFVHETPDTEDAIQQAILDQLESLATSRRD